MKKNVLLLLFLVVVIAGCGDAEEDVRVEPVRPVRVFTTNSRNQLDSRTYPGRVKASKAASLAFRLSGEVVELPVNEGDYVKKGQLIAMIDQRDYLAAVADYEAQLVGAHSLLKEATLNIKRNTKLLQEKIISQSSFDAAQSNYDSNRARVLSLEQTLRRAKLNLQYTELVAPFDGVVAKKYISNHEFVQARESIVDLEDLSSLDIVMDVPENVWVRTFKKGAQGQARNVARFESLPGKVFPLRLKEYQTNADPGTQTYKVTLTLDDAKESGVYPGMTAEISGDIQGRGEDEAVSVPFKAITGSAQERKFVWILNEDDTVSKREVEIGRISDSGMALVTSGLVPGETLVVAGVNYLYEGQKVKVLEGRIGGRQ
ncbi:efflux RND transporter periplasmic adaptor subunit [Pseudodesulfovibrio thermohalotolerans]|uniref:efflux RND transporter periplasmic adaptor subunit n=1 Tax=Pseudodesulfovibrio thermohalotolerans TaxID=2880651 RepID=UPI002441A2D6|nr:efflux RND transporter periplasmic adaptor subunit [Pseudodesulfovibrio thermohalotolerans]WFS62949.1 efflux RND transporter periplasmic adaptor subunit [Pseudodesulfovibrio thermohalotolerans]